MSYEKEADIKQYIATRSPMQKAIDDQKIATEMACIKETLKNLLDRDPVDMDYKLCSQILSDPWNGTYRLFYNQIEIGTVKYINEPDKFRVEFYPISKQN